MRVIENSADLTQGSWLETATFYDEKARPVQEIADNYKGGEDEMTSRYDFANQVICSYAVQNNPTAAISNPCNVSVRILWKFTLSPILISLIEYLVTLS